MALVIMGISFVAIVSAMGTSIISSDMHRKQASGGAALNSFAERIKEAPYVTCASTSSYSAATLGYSAPAGFSPTVVSVEYWNKGSNLFVPSLASCPTGDDGVQRISLSVASSDGRATETLQVVKRKP